MKITETYTLQEFIDYLQTEDAGLEWSEGYQTWIPLDKIGEMVIKYNNYLSSDEKCELKDFEL